MELRKTLPGAATPRKTSSPDVTNSAMRRSGRMASVSGGPFGTTSPVSTSTRRNSVNGSTFSPDLVSSRASFDADDRAAKRQKLTIGGKANVTQSIPDAQHSPGPASGLRRGPRRQSHGPRESVPVQKKTTKRLRPRRDSSPSATTAESIDLRSAADRSVDEHTEDEIVVNMVSEDENDTTSDHDKSPEEPSTRRASDLRDYVEQQNGSAPGDDNALFSKVSNWQDGSSTHGAMHDANAHIPAADKQSSSTAYFESIGRRHSTLNQMGKNSNVIAEDTVLGQELDVALPTTGAPTDQKQRNGSLGNADRSTRAVSAPRSYTTRQSRRSETPARLQASLEEAKEVADAAQSDPADSANVAADVDTDMAADTANTQSKTLTDIGTADDVPDENDLNEQRDDEDEEVDYEEEDEEMMDEEEEDEDASPMKKTSGLDITAAASDEEEDEAADAAPLIPKVIMTSASTPRPGSEEGAADQPSPESMAVDESTTAGPVKRVGRLPGRRRALHPIPKVEAALRRQHALKTLYRAVAKQLKPVLDELAKRTLTSLKENPRTHIEASEYEKVMADLQDKLQRRLQHLEKSNEYNQQKLAAALAAEEDSQRMRYRQSVRNAQSDYINKLKHDLLLTLRRQEYEQDEHASDDEEYNDVVSSLYHVNVHGRRTHILDAKYDSRSRRLIETEQRFNDVSERAYLIQSEMPTDVDAADIQPRPFTYLDPTNREAAEHDQKLKSLIAALTRPEPVKPETPKKATVSLAAASHIDNDAAATLQLLAAASVIAPPKSAAPPALPKHSSTNEREYVVEPKMERKESVSAAAKPSMAALLNDPAPPREVYASRESAYPASIITESAVHHRGPAAPSALSGAPRYSPIMHRPEVSQLARTAQVEARSSPQFEQQALGAARAPSHGYPAGRFAEQQTSIMSPHLPTLNAMQPPAGTARYVPPSPEPYHRSSSQAPSARSSLAPQGPPDSAIPDKSYTYPATAYPPAGTGAPPYLRESSGPPRQSAYAPVAAYEHAESGVRDRRPSILGPAPGERDSRAMPESTRLPPLGDIYGSSAYSRPYDPFRRSTFGAADEARRYSPPTTTLPPHIHRTSTTGSSPLASPHMSADALPDRYGRYDPAIKGRAPLNLPPSLPPFSNSAARPQSQTQLPPIPTGLPPPPLPPLRSYESGGYGTMLYKPTYTPGPPSAALPPFGLARAPLPPLGQAPQGQPSAPPPGQPQQGYGLPPIQDDRRPEERKDGKYTYYQDRR